MTFIDELRPDWQSRAACRGIDREVFFPPSGHGMTMSAKAICATCPVRAECRDYAVDLRMVDGVWGGTSGSERVVLHRDVPRRRVSVCGTESGYASHRRSDPPTPACEACKAAHAAAARGRASARSPRPAL